MDRKYITTTVTDNVLIVDLKAVTFTSGVFKELNDVIDSIDSTVKGVVFISTKGKIFLAGADLFQLNSLVGEGDYDGLRAVVQTGQDTFNKIADLKVPTVAAVNGICLGGGLELCLACDYRIASNDKSTKLGLPETTLGILPAWGGTTRLPDLIGLPNALKVILTGAHYSPKPAKKLGLVDVIVHKEKLTSAAVDMVNNIPDVKRPTSYVPTWLVVRRAKENVMKKTSGNYPAPLEVLQLIENRQSKDRSERLLDEREAFVRLCGTSEMKNLLRIFFLQEKSKKLRRYHPSKGISSSRSVKNAAVLGAGVMGAGIAQWLSSRGINVTLKDVDRKAVASGLKKIGDLYVAGVLSHKLDRPTAKQGLARITTATKDISLDNKDLVIEAIVEKLDVKQKVLSQVEDAVSDDTIIATNTSALSIDDMASCLRRPDRFVGIHFFNPVHKMKLVEIVRGKHTTDSTVWRAVEFVQSIGKLPIIVKDSPGFVVNRILVPYLAAAADMLNKGYKAEAIDKAIVAFGMPMGPFRLMDEIGLDICYHVVHDLDKRLKYGFDGINQIADRIQRGKLGKKVGEGFYKYKNDRSVKKRVTKKADITSLIDIMVEEAHKVLDEGVIDDPDMLDFAMIMGTGWSPFRGGPIKYSEHSSAVEHRVYTA